MVSNPCQIIRKMVQLLKMMTLKERHADDCDAILRQCETFLGEVERHSKRECSAFKHREESIDASYFHVYERTKISRAVRNDKASLDFVTWPVSGGERFSCTTKM